MGSGSGMAPDSFLGSEGEGFSGRFTDYIYGDRGANAAQTAALSQQEAAKKAYQQYRNVSGNVIDAFGRDSSNIINKYEKNSNAINRGSIRKDNANTVTSLRSLDQDLANQDRNLSRQEQLISQIDPTIIEASQQALKLLRGEDSSTLAPLRNQRAQQRDKLMSQLRENLGAGAETSTAGIQALNRFDSETSNILAGQQQNALSGLGSLSSQFSSQRPDILREIMGRNQIGGQQASLRNASNLYQTGLLQGTQDSLAQARSGRANSLANQGMTRAQGLFAARSPMIQSAGAGSVRDALLAQQNTQRTNAFADSSLSFGESFGGAGIGSAMGGGGGGGGGKGGSPRGYGGEGYNTYQSYA